jgi:site-specific DNA recombinase
MRAMPKAVIRCAIYTRKSSEEGLEQSFNSLDARREACQAFVTSQRQEGWRALATHYDDGGFSGGTLNRPALKRLLEDVEAKKVDTIVVYKVDRLTRGLADFAKIVEALDARGVSFVSVTLRNSLYFSLLAGNSAEKSLGGLPPPPYSLGAREALLDLSGINVI